ncbi:MAG: hypothetical protein LBS55_11125 [Prevotellaceae bacterium]|nr:hypothetical protein [Prevotellaceae bacterium]
MEKLFRIKMTVSVVKKSANKPLNERLMLFQSGYTMKMMLIMIRMTTFYRFNNT